MSSIRCAVKRVRLTAEVGLDEWSGEAQPSATIFRKVVKLRRQKGIGPCVHTHSPNFQSVFNSENDRAYEVDIHSNLRVSRTLRELAFDLRIETKHFPRWNVGTRALYHAKNV